MQRPDQASNALSKRCVLPRWAVQLYDLSCWLLVSRPHGCSDAMRHGLLLTRRICELRTLPFQQLLPHCCGSACTVRHISAVLRSTRVDLMQRLSIGSVLYRLRIQQQLSTLCCRFVSSADFVQLRAVPCRIHVPVALWSAAALPEGQLRNVRFANLLHLPRRQTVQQPDLTHNVPVGLVFSSW